MARAFTISDAALDVLSRATVTASTVTLPLGALERTLYTEVDKALKALGGKWNRSLQAHVFDRDPREAIAAQVASGKGTSLKQVLQAFYTPDDLADRLAGHLKLASGMRVLEPSCGGGALIRAAKRAAPGITITAMDIDPLAVQTCKALALNTFEADFLAQEPEQDFDAVIMNPPFTGGQDMRHVQHGFEFLKPGGRLAAITSRSWLTAENAKARAFRAFIEPVRVSQEDISAGAFKESGTDVPTLLLVLQRPHE